MYKFYFKFAFFLAIFFYFCQGNLRENPKAHSLEKPRLLGRLPGKAWVEVEPPKGALQGFVHQYADGASLFLYLKKSEESLAQFMKKFAQSLNHEGYEVIRLDNIELKNGLWLNFLAEKEGRLSRIFAKREKNYIIWALFHSKERNNLALLSPEVERYLANLEIEE